MHPALSVIFFTTLSGLGYGIWTWVGLRIAFGAPPMQQYDMLAQWLLLLAGAVLTTAGTPQDRIDRLFAAFTGLVRSEAFRDRLVPEGLTPVWDDSPSAFAAYLQTQAEYWRRLVEASGATLD